MAVIAKQLRKPIVDLVEKEAREMLSMYRAFAQRIDKKIGPLRVAVDSGSDVNYTYMQLERASRNVAAEIRRLEDNIAAWEAGEYPQIYGAGQIDALLDMGNGTGQIGFAKGVMSRRSMELLSEEIHMMQDSVPLHANALKILNETLYTGKNIIATVARRYDDVFRTMGLDVASGVVAGDETWRQAMRRELKMFDEMGLKSFTDAAGRNWKLSTYAEMVSRTVPMHVLHTGKMNEFLEYGEDLVIVSDIDPTCPLCRPWNDAVLSISGQTEGYSTVAEAEDAGLFHPRCVHSFSLYIPELERNNGSRVAQKMFVADAREESASLLQRELVDEIGDDSTQGPVDLQFFAFDPEEERRKILAVRDIAQVKAQVQGRHYEGTKEYEAYKAKLLKDGLPYKPSILTVDAQKLFDTYAGTGKIKENPDGSIIETTRASAPIGRYWYAKEGHWSDTEWFTIVYNKSKDRFHIFPVYGGDK